MRGYKRKQGASATWILAEGLYSRDIEIVEKVIVEIKHFVVERRCDSVR